MKRLQILRDEKWQWVFCRTQFNQVATTEHKQKALRDYHLEFFTMNFANDEFRVI